MPDRFVTRGFEGRPRATGLAANRVPPGQYLTNDFPVLSAGPTPTTNLRLWSFAIEGLVELGMTHQRIFTGYDVVVGGVPKAAR